MNYEIYNMDLHIGRRTTVLNPNISLSSGDTDSYKFRINFIDYEGFEEGLDWVTSAEIVILLPNNDVVYGVCDISEINEGIVNYVLQTDECLLAGMHLVEIKLMDEANNVKITSQKFKYKVIESLLNPDAILSTTTIEGITKTYKSSVAPSSPNEGDFWFNTSTKIMTY